MRSLTKGQIGLILTVILPLAGCDSTLETGYKPKHLNDSASERRAYYAPEFSPESHPSKDSSHQPDLAMPGR